MNAPGLRWTRNPLTGAAACFSENALYRYRLQRVLGAAGQEPKRWAVFVMLNPSTADAFYDDPTIRKCVGFATRWGYDGLDVVNLFGWRATHPEALYEVKDPVGHQNDAQLVEAASRGAIVVAAWGQHGGLNLRSARVLEVLAGIGDVHALKVSTKTAQPYHPLYLSSWTDPRLFVAKRVAQ